MGIPVNSIAQLSLRGLWQNQRVIFSHTYKITADASPLSPFARSQEIAGDYAAAPAGLVFRYLSAMPQNYTLKEVRFQVIYPTRYQYGSEVVSLPGLWSTDAQTGNVASVITIQTGIAGRSQIANKHVGPTPQNAMLNGAPTAAYVTKLDDLAGAILAPVPSPIGGSAITGISGIFHKGLGQFTPGEIYVISDRLGTMRRRTLRVGE
jgi:hypothetical protein